MTINWKRILEITGGVLLILLGIVMLFTPGQGIFAIVAGVVLVSPYHGRRLIWRLKEFWKLLKRKWYARKYRRVIKRKIFLKK
ncbi:MAG: PGPGW domain-containing protein [Patescibacteria group bacterium]